MSFWGEIIKPGQKKSVKLEGGDILHLSQACLHEPKKGKNYLQVEFKGTTYSVTCLELDKREHDTLDLFFEPGTTFSCKGSSEIHLMGYIEPTNDGMMDEDSEEEAAEPPKPVKPASPKLAAQPEKAKSPIAKAAASPKASPKAAAKAAADDEAEYEYEIEGEEEEEEDDVAAAAKAAASKPASPKLAAKPASPKAVAKEAPKPASPKAAAKAGADDDSDYELIMEEGEEEEPASDDLVEESEEEAPPPKKGKAPAPEAKSPKQGGEKRKAEAAPEPAAKKGDQPTAASGDEKSAYVAKLLDYLKKNGKSNVGQLGSKVPRPAGCPKLKAIFEQNKDKFNVVGDVVTAK